MLTVVSGLALLFGGYFLAILGPVFTEMMPTIAIGPTEKVWALGLMFASSVGFGIQGMLQKYHNYFPVSAALLIAAVPTTLNIFAIPITVTSVAIFAAVITIGFNAFVAASELRATPQTGEEENQIPTSSLLFGSQAIVSLLAVLPLIQLVLHVGISSTMFVAPMNCWTALQFLLTAIASCTVAWNLTKVAQKNETSNNDGRTCFAVGGIMLMLSMWTVGWIQEVVSEQIFVITALVVPATVAIAGRFLLKKRAQSTAGLVASLLMSTHLVLLAASELLGWIAMPNGQLIWVLSLAVSGISYWLISNTSEVGLNRILCYLSTTASAALLGNWFGLDFGYCLILAPMLLGTVIKIADSFWLQGENEGDFTKATPLATAGNSLVLGSGGASVLLAMSRWLEGSTGGSLMLVMMAMLACTTLVSFLTKDHYWRIAFRALIVAIVGSSICVFDGFLNIGGWHRAEICSLIGGVFLLALGHVAWSRENDGVEDSTATASLVAGALMFALPMIIGLLIYRVGGSADGNWRLFHEIGAISGSLALLGSGLLCRLRSTTIAGGSLLVCFVGSLVTLIRWPSQLQSVSVLMMIGGGLFFTTALLMSIYRDRLVSLPRRVREGEGVYRVLKWR